MRVGAGIAVKKAAGWMIGVRTGAKKAAGWMIGVRIGANKTAGWGGAFGALPKTPRDQHQVSDC